MARAPPVILAAMLVAAAGRRELEPPASPKRTTEPLCPACFELDGVDPHGNRTLQAMRWLHLPKSGSTFQNTVFHWACPGLPPRAGYGPRATGYRFKNLYSAKRAINKTICDRDVDMTIPGHPPAVADALDRTVAMFRAPKQRLISAYHNGKHCDGFQQVDKAPNWKHMSVADYARHPGIPGCTTRMMLGGKCARAKHVQQTFNRHRAAAAVRALAFVGILERWRDSICLFHKMHGGLPRDIEFAMTHSTQSHRVAVQKPGTLFDAPTPYDESVLDGVEDPDDEAVYAAALETFAAEMRRYAPRCAAERPVP